MTVGPDVRRFSLFASGWPHQGRRRRGRGDIDQNGNFSHASRRSSHTQSCGKMREIIIKIIRKENLFLGANLFLSSFFSALALSLEFGGYSWSNGWLNGWWLNLAPGMIEIFGESWLGRLPHGTCTEFFV